MMITEKVVIVAIVCATIVAICLIGSVCDILKRKGENDHEQKKDE